MSPQNNTRRIRRVLVALGHLERPSAGLLHKAAGIARASAASIELFHASMPAARAHSVADRALDSAAATARARLQRLVSSRLFTGVRVTWHEESDYPPHEAIVRRAMAMRADLVIAALRVPALPGRLWLRNTDWELIRQCPCPLLLVKARRAYQHPVIVAAIDPFHSHAKPAALDQAVLAAAAALARSLRGSVHAFHSYMPLLNTLPTPMGPVVPLGFPAEVEDIHGQQVAAVFDKLASAAGIAPANRHLHMGTVPEELSALVKRLRASIVVMGAVSRSGLRRVFIGNTAETVLDNITCDVLVIKPRGFRSPVPRAKGTRG